MQHQTVLAALAGWASWGVPYRVSAAVAGVLLTFWILRVGIPAMLSFLRPALLIAVTVAAVLALLPDTVCSLRWAAKLAVVCGD